MTPRVSYGVPHVPARGEVVHGGLVKSQHLAERFPESGPSSNLVYLVSSARPDDLRNILRAARRRDARIVWNQDGVAYPGWAGWRYRRINRPLARGLHAADHVFFQSEFCRVASDRYLGERDGGWEVLHNAVDTSVFTPGPRPDGPPTLLLGGSQYQRYRFETALRALAELRRELPGARLLVTGALSWSGDAPREAEGLVAELGVGDAVELVGPYTQEEAPELLRRADLLLHPKFNDPCPGIVLEAMACGLPVVYSASGGTPELVGEDAGVGVPAPFDLVRDHPPDPAALAAAALGALERRHDYAEAARRRAVERFDLRPWLERHREVFEMLTS